MFIDTGGVKLLFLVAQYGPYYLLLLWSRFFTESFVPEAHVWSLVIYNLYDHWWASRWALGAALLHLCLERQMGSVSFQIWRRWHLSDSPKNRGEQPGKLRDPTQGAEALWWGQAGKWRGCACGQPLRLGAPWTHHLVRHLYWWHRRGPCCVYHCTIWNAVQLHVKCPPRPAVSSPWGLGSCFGAQSGAWTTLCAPGCIVSVLC